MRNLLTFLLKHHFFFLFIFLEAIALLLIVNNNYYQHTTLINSTNQFTGSVLNTFNNICEYLHLKETNRILSEENAKLHSISSNSYIKTDTNTFFKKDILYKQQYQYIAAKVISNSTNKQNNYLMLNKGAVHGIDRDMGVVCPKGIVGIIKETSNNFSSVISMLHKDAKISAKIKKNNQLGTVEWNGKNFRIGVLNYIPAYVKISKGDTVITSGFSHIFPEGILIGTILDYKIDSGGNFYKIKIKFTVDYNKIYYVYIIKNLMKKQQLKLEKTTYNE